MIKTLSSYYLDVPLVSPLSGLTCNSFVLKIYIWNGLKTNSPVDATYTLTEQNPEFLTDSISVNIAKMINDFIDFKPQVVTSNFQNGNNQVWVRTEIFYSTDNSSELNTPQLINVSLALKGYGYAMEGLNPQPPTNNILLTNNEFKVSLNSKFIVPVLVDESEPLPIPSMVINNLVLLSGDSYSLQYSIIGDVSNLLYNYGTYTIDGGLPVGFSFDENGNSQDLDLIIEGDYVFTLYAYDNNSFSDIQSNSYPVTISSGGGVDPLPNIIILDVVPLITPNNYSVLFTSVGTYSDFILEKRQGTIAETEVLGVTSPQTIVTSLTGSVEVEMRGFDTGTSSIIISNVFNLNI